MDSIRRFIANFQKQGTISWLSGERVKVLKNIENNKKTEDKLVIDVIPKLNDVTPMQDTTDNPKNVVSTSEPTESTNAKNFSTVNTESSCSKIDTSECLAEFNEILQEIKIDTESVTLEDIDDVLNEITEENVETSSCNTPRFDLHDLVDNFSSVFEQNDVERNCLRTNSDKNVEPKDFIDISDLPNYLVEDFDEAFDENKLIKNIILIKNETSKEFIENIEQPDVISISSEDSQVSEPIIKRMDDKEILEPIDIKLEQNNKTDTTNDLRNVNTELNNTDFPSQDEIPIEVFNVDSENNIAKETKKANFEDEKLNWNLKNTNEQDYSNPLKENFTVVDENEVTVKTEDEPLRQDMVNFYSCNDKDESTYLNPEITVKQYLTEELKESVPQEAQDYNRNQEFKKPNEIMNIEVNKNANMKVEIDNCYGNNSQDIISINSDETEIESVNENEKVEINTSKAYDSDDCGYISSDFEFITEDEAKLDGLIVNFNPNVTKTQTQKLNKHNVKSIEISVDRYSTFCSSEKSEFQEEPVTMNNYDLKSNDVEPIDISRCVTQDINSVQENKLGLRSFRRNKNIHQTPQKCQNSMQDTPIYSECNLDPFTIRTHGNYAGHLTDRASLEEPVPSDFDRQDFSGRNPGPSIERQMISDLDGDVRPSILRGNRLGTSRNCTDASNDIERWREFQKRRRNQFLDQSYRDYHLVPSNEDYYQLFNPNYLPLPNQNMRLENKSTLSVNTMLIEYDGVGFDMQMMRGNVESEDDEVKEEAAACARRILQMYPRENRKRPRRF